MTANGIFPLNHPDLNAVGERLRAIASRPWALGLANVVALLLLASQLADLTWRMTSPKEPVLATGPATSREVTFDPASLEAADLFGHAAGAPASGENVPVSSLNLSLSGIVAAGAGSIALIGVAGAPAEPFAIGQEIVPGVVLQTAYADRVLIRRGAAVESLVLETSAPLAGMGAAPTGARAATAALKPSQGVQAHGHNQFTLTRDFIQEQMRAPDFLGQAQLLQQASGGFLVRDIKSGSVFEKLGLRAGDVITAVNGQQLTSVEDTIKFYQQIGNVGTVQLELRRGGRVENLQYNIQ